MAFDYIDINSRTEQKRPVPKVHTMKLSNKETMLANNFLCNTSSQKEILPFFSDLVHCTEVEHDFKPPLQQENTQFSAHETYCLLAWIVHNIQANVHTLFDYYLGQKLINKHM